MQIANTLPELIGNTPLLRLERFAPGAGVLAKLESFNPLSSAKDRAGLYMILDAEERGLLQPGAVIVEPTSGNTGVALAYIGRQRGYRVVLTMPETMSQERRSLLAALGAELVLTEGARALAGHRRRRGRAGGGSGFRRHHHWRGPLSEGAEPRHPRGGGGAG